MNASRVIRLSLRLAGAILLLVASSGARAQSDPLPSQPSLSPQNADRRLVLYNTHTGERLDIVYRHNDHYDQSALAKLDYFLRDHQTNDVRHFDPRLYDTLSDLTLSVGHSGGEIDIVCGYRTPRSE